MKKIRPSKEELMHNEAIEDAREDAIQSVLCIRCIRHLNIGMQNTNEFSGGECGGCIAEERDALRSTLRQVQAERDEARAQCDAVRVALDASPYVPLAEAAKGYVSAYEDVVSEKMAAEEKCETLRAERDEALKFQQENYETILALRAHLNEALSQLKTLGEELEEATVGQVIAENQATDLRSALADKERQTTEGWMMEPTPEMVKAALESSAPDDEGQWPILLDLLDCSGEDKSRRIVHAALKAALAVALPAPPAIGGENS